MLYALFGQTLAKAPFLPVDSIEEILDRQNVGDFSGSRYESFRDPTVDIEAQAVADQLSAKLHQFIDSLPQKLRRIVRQHYWSGLTQSEIANELGTTRSAVCHALAKVNRLGRAHFGISEH